MQACAVCGGGAHVQGSTPWVNDTSRRRRQIEVPSRLAGYNGYNSGYSHFSFQYQRKVHLVTGYKFWGVEVVCVRARTRVRVCERAHVYISCNLVTTTTYTEKALESQRSAGYNNLVTGCNSCNRRRLGGSNEGLVVSGEGETWSQASRNGPRTRQNCLRLPL